MILAPQTTFRNMESDPELEEFVLKEVAKLERFFPRIMSCRVAIEGPRRQEFGGLFDIRIDLGVPGEELLVEHNPSLHANLQSLEETRKTKRSEPHRERRNAERAIREAFHEMRRRLQDYARRMREQGREGEGLLSGKVIRLSPDEDFGVIQTDDGREVYFHRNSVLAGHFDRLSIGNEVRFAEEMGEKGPQASTVKLARSARHGAA